MSVAPFLRHQPFDPETIETISAAFGKICAELRLSLREDRLTEIVARKVIEAAQRGVRDETAIRITVLQEFKSTN